MENKNIALLLTAFIMIIIGAVLINVIAEEEQKKTVLTHVTNESQTIEVLHSENVTAFMINLTKVQTIENDNFGSWKTGETDCEIQNFVLLNETYGTLTVTTDYVIDVTYGNYTMVNTSAVAGEATNATHATYDYCGDDYMSQGWSRSVLNLTPGFVAFALLAAGLGLFFGVMKNEGLLGI